MATPDYYIKRGDERPRITSTLTDPSGAALDISAADSVWLKLSSEDGSTFIFLNAGQIDDAAAGEVGYTPSTGDFDIAEGDYLAEFVLYWGTSQTVPQTFPGSGYKRIRVTPALPSS